MGRCNLRITYDTQVDALYIYLTEKIRAAETREIDGDIALDFDVEERLVGVEVLEASKRLDLEHLLPFAELLGQKESAGLD
jgi:uncharacterized protein YuzE